MTVTLVLLSQSSAVCFIQNHPTEILMASVLWISFEPFMPFSKSSYYLLL